MQRITARKMRRHDIWIPRIRAIVQKAPFVDGSFDAIVSTFPAGYILDPATLREVARLLRPPDPGTGTRGGRFIVVGLYADTKSQLLRRAARLVFATTADCVLARYERIATAAGLHVTVTAENDKGLSMPIIISQRHTHHPPDTTRVS